MTPSSTAPIPAGHPRGIYTLYFTEMWERMSYYGMRAILILYMVKSAVEGGLGMDEKTAGAIYGLYTCAVYLVTLPGGWIADRLIGPQRAVFIGGCIIAAGHFTLAIRDPRAFFIGLLLVVLGTALLKPNISALVGHLYPEGGARRDAGFTLFYMGINLGGLLGPLICGYLGERVNWHYGFAASGVGMVLGLIQYALTRRHLGEAGLHPSEPSTAPGRDWALVWAALAGILLVTVLAFLGIIVLKPVALAQYTGMLILVMAVLWFGSTFALGGLTVPEKKRLVVLLILFFASALFWSGFEQVGSVMSLFAERYTERNLMGGTMPASWFQSLNPLLILLLAVPVSVAWLGLARRGISPSFIVKFAGGLLLLAAGFLLMYFAARQALAGAGKVSALWLCTTYFLHTVGELFLSPVGLSAVTKLAPAKLTSQALGIWFLGASLGNLLAGLLAGGMSSENVANMPMQFMKVALIAGAGGLVMLLCAPLIKKLMPGVE
jgi:POT family proton-dependent oligopeptide transporter